MSVTSHDFDQVDIEVLSDINDTGPRLDLQNLELRGVPPLVVQKTIIEELILAHNQLTTIPNDIRNLLTLRGLDLSANLLTTLPLELRECVAIEGLNLRGNQLRLVPACVPQLVMLKILDLSNNMLYCLPSEIGKLMKCERLYVNGNRLRSLPKEIGQMQKLRRLHAAENELAVVPTELGNLVNLAELDISANNLTRLPSQLGRMLALRIIQVADNPLTWPPLAVLDEGPEAVLQFLKHADELHDREFVVGSRQHFDASVRAAATQAVSQEKIESVCNQCKDRGDVALDLSSKGLVNAPDEPHLPSSLAGLHKLRQMFLNKNNLTEVPLQVCQLADLIGLNLGYNKITMLPTEISDLSLLQALNLGTNQLSELPPTIGRLTSLMVLDLYGNRLRRLPAEIGQLRALRRLYVDNNCLEEVPTEIGNLRNLLRLYLGQNKLPNVPHQVFELAGLQELDLCNNQLHTLPQHDIDLRNLLWLGVSGNPDLQCPAFPSEILNAADGRLIADYLRKRSYHDLIGGNLGSRLFERMHFQRAARFCKQVEQSELAAVVAEQLDRLYDSADKATTLSRYTNSEYRVADGWRCKVKDLDTEIEMDYFMTISDTGIELKEPHLVRDDDTFVYPLMEETDVTEKDEHTLLVVLSDYHQIEIDTAPAPATSLMVQLQYTLSKQFLAYRAKTYLAEYICMMEKFEKAFVLINELIDSKTEAIGALVDLCGLVESKLPKGEAFRQHETRAQEMCGGEHFVVVQMPGTGQESAPPGVRNVISVSAAESACKNIADDSLKNELACQAKSLKEDVQQLTTTMQTARLRLEEEHRDLMLCIHSDKLAVATTLADLMLQVRGVDYRTIHDVAHKAGARRIGLSPLTFCHLLCSGGNCAPARDCVACAFGRACTRGARRRRPRRATVGLGKGCNPPRCWIENTSRS
jgi:Leucine-rich repeat (LRR) protein